MHCYAVMICVKICVLVEKNNCDIDCYWKIHCEAIQMLRNAVGGRRVSDFTEKVLRRYAVYFQEKSVT